MRPPLERGVLTVNLEPGTYSVYSPIGDDREEGLEVTGPPPSQNAGEQPGVGPSDRQDPIEDEGP